MLTDGEQEKGPHKEREKVSNVSPTMAHNREEEDKDKYRSA